MAGERKLQKGEFKFLQSVMALGAVVGLVAATGGPAPSSACKGGAGVCFGDSVIAVAKPYLVHGGVGALIGAAAAAVLVCLWRWRHAGQPAFATTAPREAIAERVRHEVWRRD